MGIDAVDVSGFDVCMRLPRAASVLEAWVVVADFIHNGIRPTARLIRMRELPSEEIKQVSGGFLPAVALALMLAGCSHTQSLRRGEKPNPEVQ